METVCLVIPPSLFLLDDRVFMTIGILKVAAVLEERGYRVEMVDLSGIENFEAAIGDHARSSKAKSFGITATTPQLPAATRVAKAIKAARPDARTILGGPHVTLTNAAYKREQKLGALGRAKRAFDHIAEVFDVLVAGDGEDTITLALSPNVDKLIDADEPKSALFLSSKRLAELPMPARHLLDVSSYHYTIDGVPAVSLIAQLGCPFNCGFCGGRDSPFLRRTRQRPTQNVVEEIAHLHSAYGFRGFMLYDDELNVNPKMVELMREIGKTARRFSTEFRLRGFVKAELFDEAQAEAMYDAGFRWLLCGFESGSPRILRNINKKATREDNDRCMAIAQKHGLKVKALMSIGHPGESEETILETRDWLLRSKPADFDVTIITPYPGSPYYDHATPHVEHPRHWTYEIFGDRLHSIEINYTEVADYYKGDPNGGYRSFVYTDFISTDGLVELRDLVEREVRKDLGIAFNPSAAAIRYEHSMGQFGAALPPNILRTTEAHTVRAPRPAPSSRLALAE
jgi:radical SAM superfamily enzyme YgiQ (UPF0313 family)